MGHLFFPVLSHMDLVDDVAGVAPVPSPSTAETWIEPLEIFIYEHFAFRVHRNCYLTPLFPQITSRHGWGAQE